MVAMASAAAAAGAVVSAAVGPLAAGRDRGYLGPGAACARPHRVACLPRLHASRTTSAWPARPILAQGWSIRRRPARAALVMPVASSSPGSAAVLPRPTIDAFTLFLISAMVLLSIVNRALSKIVMTSVLNNHAIFLSLVRACIAEYNGLVARIVSETVPLPCLSLWVPLPPPSSSCPWSTRRCMAACCGRK